MCRHLRVMLLALLSLAAGQAMAEDVKLCVNPFGGNVRAPGSLGQCLKWERVLTISTGGGGRSFQYKIGDTGPGGGIVFFVDYHDQYPGFDYLEAAPADLPGGYAYRWCGSDTQVLGASGWDANAVGRGQANTNAIIAAGCNTANDATQAAKNYTGGGKGDWFLPSMGELMLMYATWGRRAWARLATPTIGVLRRSSPTSRGTRTSSTATRPPTARIAI